MPEDNRFKFSNFNDVFGELQNIHRVRRSKSETFLIIAVLLFLLIFGVITYIASDDILTLPFCVILPSVIFCMVVWQTFSTKNDELKIYQNGFTYKSAKSLKSCLWNEIENYKYVNSRHRQSKEIEQGIFPLDSITKKNGEIIEFTNGLGGTTEVENRIKDFQKTPKRRRKNH